MKAIPEDLIHKLHMTLYAKAKVIFWSGSVSRNAGTETSDLDLVVIFDRVSNAYREAFVFDGWPVDVFVHDPETLQYFYEQVDGPSFIPALPQMVADGIQFPKGTDFGKSLQKDAQKFLDKGPVVTESNLHMRRFHITDLLDDLKSVTLHHEKMAILCHLYEKLAEFYLLSNRQWIGHGKQLTKKLETFNPHMAHKFEKSFFLSSDWQEISNLTFEILEPYGGLLWDGFKADAPADWKAKIPPSSAGNTIIIYLTGKPGVGKYTIAKELAAKHGFIVCDNQLINNPIFELLQYDGYAKIPDFAWDTISCIRTEVLDFLAKNAQNSYVLTNCLADTDEDRQLYEQVKQMAEKRGSLFIPVALEITKEEHLKRLTRQERRARWKSVDPSHAEDNDPLICISHPNLLELNVSKLSPEDAVDSIMNHIKILNQR